MARTVVPMSVFADEGWRVAARDEFLRPDTTLEGLAGLRTPFRVGGRVTAGNSAGLTDGATAGLLASEAAAAELGLEPTMRLVGFAYAGVEPHLMGIGPVPATERVLAQAGLTIDDIGLFELNEPFAVQVLTWCDGVGVAPDDPRLNPSGGAIACGHPLAATGVRLMAQLADELGRRPDVQYGLTALCIGLGMGARSCGRTRAVAESPTRFSLQEAPSRVGPIALVTMDNGEDWRKPNVFGSAALESLGECLATLRARTWSGLVLTGKPFVFATGADLTEFPRMSTPELARAAAVGGHRAFGAIRDLPFPTLAAINGAAVGGGLEIALHCDFRTMARSVRHVGFPEVFLGIIPAWGGTQLATRLVGASAAVELIVANPLAQNRFVGAARAAEVGLVDDLLDDVEFLDDSIEWLVRAIESPPPARDAIDLSDAAAVCAKARFAVDDAVHGVALAPYRALDLIAGAAEWTIADGYEAEEDALADLLPGPQAQAAVYAFDLIERRIKKGIGVPDAKPRRIERVGIVGAGLMATQLATLFLRRLEVPVVLTDIDAGRVDDAVAAISADLAKQVSRGRLAEGKARFLGSLVSGTTEIAEFGGCDLVIEAVFEELAVKQAVFASLESVVPEECLLVTNTSSLSVAAMAAGLEHPERVVGMHFFNPVSVLPLVELVRAPGTDETTLATAWDVTRKLGKRGVLVRDAPAFVVNRLLTRQSSVLMRALENGSTLRGDRRGRAPHRDPDAAVGTACDGRPKGRESRAPHAARRLPRAIRALPDPRELRQRGDGHRDHGGRAADRRRASRGTARRPRRRDPHDPRRRSRLVGR